MCICACESVRARRGGSPVREHEHVYSGERITVSIESAKYPIINRVSLTKDALVVSVARSVRGLKQTAARVRAQESQGNCAVCCRI